MAAATDTDALVQEATSLNLFRMHGAFEVHCSNCHARLDARGDCQTCGLIGRSPEQARKHSSSDDALDKLLSSAIAKRRAYRPYGAKAERGAEG